MSNIVRIDNTLAVGGLVLAGGGGLEMGSSAQKVVNDAADTKFVSIYTDCGATSGDSRGLYLRHYLTGAGGGGESARLFTTVDNVIAATAHGAHISLNFNTTGKLTGLGVAARATLHIPNQAMAGGGHYAAIQAEVYSDGSSSDPAGMQALSLFRVVNGGDATGGADVDDDACLFQFEGWTPGSGNLITAVGNEPTWASKTRQIRCRLPDGSLTYLITVDP